MAVIENPVPNISVKALKKIYINRKLNNLEKCSWKLFSLKYKKTNSKYYFTF